MRKKIFPTLLCLTFNRSIKQIVKKDERLKVSSKVLSLVLFESTETRSNSEG